jgi:4-amino-4-deoxy-L-arabinose transferase-like glycosyltransferase
VDTTKQSLIKLGDRRLLKEGLIVTFLILAIWMPRGFSLDKFVSTDEIAWLVRSANFYYALGQRNLEGTFQKGHPGVTTMWVNTAAFLIEHPEYRGFQQGQFDSFLTFERFADSQGIDSHAVLVTGRSIMVGVHTILLIIGFYLARRLIGFMPALVGFLLLIFEPFYIGLTRLSHLDGLVGTLALVSVLAFMVYAFEDQKLRFLIVSAIAASAASLTKVTGLIILPALGIVFVLMIIFHRQEQSNETRQQFLIWFRKILAHMFLYGAVILLVYFVLWPAMWVNPLGTLIEQYQGPGGLLTETERISSSQADDNQTLYADKNNEIFRYPKNFLWRVTPISLAGLLIWLFFFIKREGILSKGKVRWISWSLLAFAFTYTVLLTIPEKSNFRYWIPAYISLLLLAGIGWAALLNTAVRRFPDLRSRSIGFLVILVILLIQFFGILRTYPYYFTYYNPLLGGSKQAGKSISVGEGEGLDQAGLYLSSVPNAEKMTVMSWYGWGSFSYYFSGKTIIFPVTSKWSGGLAEKLSDSDYLVVYQNQWYRRIPPELFDSLDQVDPMKTIWVDDIEYARIYEVDSLPDQIFTP